jgi:hypothetical protein
MEVENVMTSKESNTPASLFSEEEMALEKVGSPVFTGASTGERLISQRPDLYRITVQLLGQGTGIREIKRLTGLHHRTIEAVMIREGQTIDTHRKELGARALKVAAMGVERLEEIIADGAIKPGELSMAVGILIDKGQVLTGGVTARVEKIEQSQVAAGLERMLDDLPVIDAEWEEEVSGTNLGEQNTQTIAALLDASDAGLDADLLPVDPVDLAGDVVLVSDQSTSSSDEQSVVSVSPISVEEVIVSASVSDQPRKKASKSPRKTPAAKSKAKASKEGGRGSAKSLNPKNPD